MKRTLIGLLTFPALLLMAAMPTKEILISIQDKHIKLPTWGWNTGEVRSREMAGDNKTINLLFDRTIYKEGDRVKITFNTYKVSITGITPITTFKKWSGMVKLMGESAGVWSPIVKDTNDRINRPFTNTNNHPSDSLVNYSFNTIVPNDFMLPINVSPQSFELDTINGNGKPMFTNGHLTITTSIKGLEVEKL